jgi:hypothetical protein
VMGPYGAVLDAALRQRLAGGDATAEHDEKSLIHRAQ